MAIAQVYLSLGSHQLRCRVLVGQRPHECMMAVLGRLAIIAIPKDDTSLNIAVIGHSNEILSQVKAIDPNVESLFIATGS